jgi:hypothetical protein
MKLDRRFDGLKGSLYDKCAVALATVRAESAAAYDATFGDPGAVAAAVTMHAMRYASPNDPRGAMEYGPDAVVSVVACLFDETPLTATRDVPRLIDSAVIEKVDELGPIVAGAKRHLAAR